MRQLILLMAITYLPIDNILLLTNSTNYPISLRSSFCNFIMATYIVGMLFYAYIQRIKTLPLAL